MTEIGITTLLIIIANIFCSVQGLNDHPSFEKFTLNVNRILVKKEYLRLLTAGFFHVSWLHLVVNIATLCFFSGGLELNLGWARYLLIYFGSLLAGNLFALFVHRRHGDFCSAGASGGITGIVFATIALFPHFQIGFLGIHFAIPGWFYGFLYVLFSIYGIQSKRDNIGHEANLAGGLAGLAIVIMLSPSSFIENYIAILSVAISSAFFISIIITRPQFILIDNKFYYDHKRRNKIARMYQSGEIDHQVEIDRILEKIHQNGIASLTRIEKDKLDFYSRIIQ